MRIGIVTLYDLLNYGNRLQNYSTIKILTDLVNGSNTVDTLVINEMSDKDILKNMLGKKKTVYDWNWYQENDNYISNLSELELLKYNKFKEFSYKYTNIKKIEYYKRFPQKINNKYDFFVAGSDQIWNPFLGQAKDWEFLSFANKSKRISWAASFGVTDLKKYEKNIGKRLKGFNEISVREENGKDIVKRLTKKESTVLIDPTLMLSKEDWLEIAQKPLDVDFNKPYILTFFLGDRSENINHDIAGYATKYNFEVKCLNDISDDKLYISGPCEFLYLIANATLVITDSFHACIFSILFGKPFKVYMRNWSYGNISSRIDTLLEKFGLDRKAAWKNLDNDIMEADYDQVYNILEKEREKTIHFLKNALC